MSVAFQKNVMFMNFMNKYTFIHCVLTSHLDCILSEPVLVFCPVSLKNCLSYYVHQRMGAMCENRNNDWAEMCCANFEDNIHVRNS